MSAAALTRRISLESRIRRGSPFGTPNGGARKPPGYRGAALMVAGGFATCPLSKSRSSDQGARGYAVSAVGAISGGPRESEASRAAAGGLDLSTEHITYAACAAVSLVALSPGRSVGRNVVPAVTLSLRVAGQGGSIPPCLHEVVDGVESVQCVAMIGSSVRDLNFHF